MKRRRYNMKNQKRQWWIILFISIIFAITSWKFANSRVAVYETSITLRVPQETYFPKFSLSTHSESIQHLLRVVYYSILSDDIIIPQIIEPWKLTVKEVSVPPLRVPALAPLTQFYETIKQTMFQKMPYDQYELSSMEQVAEIIQKNFLITYEDETFLTLKYKASDLETCRTVLNSVVRQCKEVLLRSKKQEIREELRALERTYQVIQQKFEEYEQQVMQFQSKHLDKGAEEKSLLLYQYQQALDKREALRFELLKGYGKHQLTPIEEELKRQETYLTEKINEYREQLILIRQFEHKLNALQRQRTLYEPVFLEFSKYYEHRISKLYKDFETEVDDAIPVIKRSTRSLGFSQKGTLGILWLVFLLCFVFWYVFCRYVQSYWR